MAKKPGRKLQLTPAMIDEICAHIAKGVSFRDAAAMCDIGQTTFYRWKRQAKRAKSGIFAEFAVRLRKAEAEAVATLIGVAVTAAEQGREIVTVKEHYDADGNLQRRIVETQRLPRDPNLALKILEHRNPKRYGRAHRLHHSGEVKGGGGNVPVRLIFDDGEGADKDGRQAVVETATDLPPDADAGV